MSTSFLIALPGKLDIKRHSHVFSIYQIDTYEKIYEEAEHIEPLKVFDSWFRIDAKPFKQALLNIIKRWSFMFKQHLIDHVTNRYVLLHFIS